MAIVLDLRQGAPAEDQLIYIKEQLERHLTELEDSVGGVKSVETVLMDDNTIKLIITDNDGNKTEEEIRNAAGVKNIITQYYLSESYLDQAGGEWTESQPAWADGYYLWQRTKITWDDGTSSSTTPRLLTAVNDACERATTAQTTAGEAKTTATAAQAKANAAQTSASAARTAAEEAKSSATAAATAASAAQTRADDAYTYAGQAKSAADDADAHALTAKNRADEAYTYAGQAATSAGEAKTQATAATSYANGALTGLSTVQDVIGVLNWAQKNAQYSLTGDTDIVPGKTYWTRSGSGTEADPYTYAPVVSPVKTQLSNYYEISGVDEAMANYINAHLALLNDGLYVLSDNSGWKVRIANDGVYIVDTQGNTATKYKDAVTLGNDDGSQSYQYLDYHSLQMIDKEGDTYFYVSDLRDKQTGRATLEEAFTGDGETTDYTVIFYPYSTGTCSVTVNGTEVEFLRDYKVFTLSDAPAAGASIIITYQTSDAAAKAFTFGNRNTANSIGAHSFAAGRYVTASGYASHAENIWTVASGNYSHAEGGYSEASGHYSHAEGHSTASGEYSHAEGYGAQATGKYSHAEGYATSSIMPLIASGISSHAEGKSVASGNYSHAEGYARAQGDYSHAEGYNVAASGDYSHAEGKSSSASGENSHAEGYHSMANGLRSHAQNFETIASGLNQTALGRYNIEDNDDTYSVIIGNGTDDDHRSNAATVDWQGNLWAAGSVTENNGTRDIDLNISEATIALYDALAGGTSWRE